jgi:hypothetical protein
VPSINNPIRATYYVAKNNDGSVIHEGILRPSNNMYTGQPILQQTENEYIHLKNLDDIKDQFPALPSPGTELEEGSLYVYGGKIVKVRQTHIRTNHSPEDVPALFTVFREDATEDDHLEWIPNESVEIGMIREYQGDLYECIQAHVTQADWTPIVVPALWQLHFEDEQDDGSPWRPFESVSVGDIREYQGVLYEVIQAHTTQVGWEPPVVPALWQVVDGQVTPTPPEGLPYPLWSPNSVSYSIGDRVVYNMSVYECLQAHVSQEAWNPSAAPSLWTFIEQVVTPTPEPTVTATPEPTVTATPEPTPEEWSGESVQYNVGDLVTYEGDVYECIQAHESQPGWNPPSVPSLWVLV